MNETSRSAKPVETSRVDGQVSLRHIIRTTIRSKFPLAPEGTHRATCIEVEVGDSTFANAQPGDKIIRLTWEIAVPMKGNVGFEKKVTIRSKAMGVYFSPTSALTQLINTLTGSDAAYTTVDRDEDGNAVIDFDASVFVGMQCSVTIAHIQHFNKTYANIIEYQTDDHQKAENSKRLSA
ncbi:MAG: hypothetical protein AAB728_03965 [Patescibacteria group bacterium]